MGESADDFVVQTESKLRQSILNLTKVASNGYKGFDILDDNGNYKGFYERMVGLSEIYEELQEQDKKLGNNSATALIELIAGKNMSAVAGSILSNPEMLKKAYDVAMDAEGSAATELDKKLDTIDAKMNQLSTHGQEFWTTFLDSETVKGFVDVLSDFVNGLTELIKTFHTLPVVATAFAAVLSAKNFGKTIQAYRFSSLLMF